MLKWLLIKLKNWKEPEANSKTDFVESQHYSSNQGTPDNHWWRNYDPRTSSKGYSEQRKPKFSIGEKVLIQMKPSKPRSVISIKWHNERSEWVYHIQHFKRPNDKSNPAYWFEDQLGTIDTNG